MTNLVSQIAQTALQTVAAAPEATQTAPHIASTVEATSDWLASFTAFVDKIDGYVWGVPLIASILVTGLLLTCILRLTHLLNLKNAFRCMFAPEEGHGEVSQFGALCTALSATIGTGNIVGVATAIGTGGPGALFWMEVAAFFGMATKYAEGLLAVKYREVQPDGTVLGGPFYYIERGLKGRFGLKSWKWLAVLFAVFGAKKVMRYFPPIVTGPMIIMIGLNLAGSASIRRTWRRACSSSARPTPCRSSSRVCS